MSIRKSHWTNIKGNRVEFAADIYKWETRHFKREAKSQKVQYKSHSHGTSKDIKRPMHDKIT
ncbi:hypothetical protein [Thermoanaerobacterium thermosaccharolyticum]|uniref:Uncharacterized protein n=1 Tax=Thermoanaerobacterium thermosaccharolyticum M0795 TaxID=698948 RepID=L0IH23_THETR|nr:hypothetical protein [Thermoanaerobacterium thermosaccharolyticum]AGB18064.1 hypothetical protein Thethe_00336 [Thermoanaerobacterium thermosaccharolyticum M0795]